MEKLKCVCRDFKKIEGLHGIESGKEYDFEVVDKGKYKVFVNKNNSYEFPKSDFDILFKTKENK